MRILILGGHGFIGSHTSHILYNQGHEVAIVDCHHQYFTYPDNEYETILNQRKQQFLQKVLIFMIMEIK